MRWRLSFANIKGQDSAVSFLKSAITNDKLSHAYIFLGPVGVGKRLTAMAFAKALGCGALDVSIIGGGEEGEQIKIEDVRLLIKDIYRKPFESKKKVYIIDGADNMKYEAAGALLKTLEEPPTDSIIILMTEKIEALFHTIVSRCQIVRFFPLKMKEIELLLTKEHSLDETNARILAHLSGGRLGEALRFKDADIFTKRSSFIKSVSSRPSVDLDFDNVDKEDFRLYLDMLLSWYRDVLNTKAGSEERVLVNIDKKSVIADEARKMSFECLEDIINDIMLTFGYLDQNANRKLAMSVLALKINKAAKCTK